MMESLFGVEMPTAGKVMIAFLVVIGLIGGITWAVRRFGGDRFGSSAARGRQPRLAVIDAAAVDGRRKLVIIRRDNVEHLLMIGGPTDVVVETNIVRAVGAPRDVPRETPTGRATGVSDTLPRAVPLSESTMWPLQPQPEAPRPHRATVSEDPMQWTFQQPPEQPSRPQRPADTLAGLAEELSGRPAPQREPNPSNGRTPPNPEPSRTHPPQVQPPHGAGATDENLAEMAHRLEAALRGPAEPRRGAEAAAKPEAKSPASEPKPARAETKPSQPKTMYDSLEQEMASLLGRPPGKT